MEDDKSLPPLLERLPKDFGVTLLDDDDEDFGTMVVKTKNKIKTTHTIANKLF